jgi:hypothetical protein
MKKRKLEVIKAILVERIAILKNKMKRIIVAKAT